MERIRHLPSAPALGDGHQDDPSIYERKVGRGVVEPLRVECALAYLPGIARSAIRAALPFVELDRVVVAPVPVDPRHEAKVDYAKLQRLVGRYARAS
jgi:hypothetical protein